MVITFDGIEEIFSCPNVTAPLCFLKVKTMGEFPTVCQFFIKRMQIHTYKVKGGDTNIR